MLSWLQVLAQSELAKTMQKWLATLRLGHPRAVYLRAWLTHDLPTRWLRRPILIQLGFTLLLHDHPFDVLHVLRAYLHTRQHRLRDERLLLAEQSMADGKP